MSSMNIVALTGRVGNVEQVILPDGKVKINISISLDQHWSEDAKWIQVICWGKNAAFAAKYIQVGYLIGIQAHLDIQKWQEEAFNISKGEFETITRKKMVVVCDRVEILASSKPKSQAEDLL